MQFKSILPGRRETLVKEFSQKTRETLKANISRCEETSNHIPYYRITSTYLSIVNRNRQRLLRSGKIDKI